MFVAEISYCFALRYCPLRSKLQSLNDLYTTTASAYLADLAMFVPTPSSEKKLCQKARDNAYAQPGIRGNMQQNTERWRHLCELASVEQDSEKLVQLVREINDLLEAKRRRLVKPDASGEANMADEVPDSVKPKSG